MPYVGEYPLSLIDQTRLNVGDIDPNFEVLNDQAYEWYLDKNSNNVRLASLDAARAILFSLSRFTRERTGDIEVYGAEWASNYRRALELFLKDPNFNVAIAMPYAGGISKQDMYDNDANTDNVRPKLYVGIADGETSYNTTNDDNLFEF